MKPPKHLSPTLSKIVQGDVPLFLRTNYGDDSIAMVQWLAEQELGLTATVVYVDTGWAAEGWETRVELGEAHARQLGFQIEHLQAKIPFADAVMGRSAFPSVKFHWCTALLKGLPFLDWLETIDLKGEGVILLAKRKSATHAHAALSEWIEHCEFHHDRKIWHPILAVNDAERDILLQRAGFSPLQHRSLECEPCVNSTQADFDRMNNKDKIKLQVLEEEVGKLWQESPSSISEPAKYLDLFYRSCGNPFGCGL